MSELWPLVAPLSWLLSAALVRRSPLAFTVALGLNLACAAWGLVLSLQHPGESIGASITLGQGFTFGVQLDPLGLILLLGLCLWAWVQRGRPLAAEPSSSAQLAALLAMAWAPDLSQLALVWAFSGWWLGPSRGLHRVVDLGPLAALFLAWWQGGSADWFPSSDPKAREDTVIVLLIGLSAAWRLWEQKQTRAPLIFFPPLLLLAASPRLLIAPDLNLVLRTASVVAAVDGAYALAQGQTGAPRLAFGLLISSVVAQGSAEASLLAVGVLTLSLIWGLEAHPRWLVPLLLCTPGLGLAPLAAGLLQALPSLDKVLIWGVVPLCAVALGLRRRPSAAPQPLWSTRDWALALPLVLLPLGLPLINSLWRRGGDPLRMWRLSFDWQPLLICALGWACWLLASRTGAAEKWRSWSSKQVRR